MVSLTFHLARLVFAPPQRDYDLHRDLCHAFTSRRDGTYLFRSDLDRSSRPVRRVVLVQSSEPADWTRLAGRLASHEVTKRDWILRAGDHFRFFLRANATRAKKASLRELAKVRGEAFRALRGKRVGVRGEAQLVAWLRRQGERYGFRLIETDFRQEDGTTVAVPALRVLEGRDVEWRGRDKRGQHVGADFEGLLTVENPEQLAVALRRGIGAGKAFGFGLLSLAPIR